MPEYQLTIIVTGVDQTGPAVQGMDRMGVGGVAAGNLIANAMQSAAGAVVGFVGASLSAAGAFEQNMNVLQAASGATTAQMAQMSSMAMALGNDLTLPGTSASDAATAMLELTRAGLSVDDTMGAATGTLQLAAAAETDAATAAAVVAAALNAFGMAGSEATAIVDQLAGASNASTANITDLSQGFNQAGFAFNAANQSAADLSTSLAILTKNGLTGSDAGTALKNAMMQLMAPTQAGAAEMAKYGINVRDASGQMLPAEQIIGIFTEKLGGLPPALRDSAMKTILLGDGMKAMLPLMDAGADGFAKMKEEITRAGSAQALAEAQTKGFNGALASVGSAVETLQLAFLPLLPALSSFLSIVATAVSGIATFVQGILSASDPMAALGAAIDSVLPGFTTFIGFIQANAMPILVGLGAILATVLVPVLFAAGVAAVGVAASFMLMIAPFVAVGLAAALLYQAFQTNFMGLATIIQPLIDAVMVGFGEGGIGGAFTALIAQLGVVGPQIGAWLLSVGQLILTNVLAWGLAFVSWVAPYVPIVLTALGNLALSIGGWIAEQAAPILAQLGTWAQAFVAWIVPATIAFLTAWPAMLNSFLDWIGSAVGPILLQLGMWALAFMAWIAPMIGPFLLGLGAIVAALLVWAGETVFVLAAKLLEWAGAFIDWIAPAITGALGALGGFIAGVLGWIAEQPGILLAGFAAWASAFIAWIPGATVAFLAAWPGMLSQFLDWIGAQPAAILAQLGTWAAQFVAWIAPMIPQVLAELLNLAAAIGEWIVTQAAPFLLQLAVWGLQFIAWVAPMIPGMLIAVAAIAAALIVFIGETVGTIAGKLIEWATAFTVWVATDVLPKLPGVLATIWTSISTWIGETVPKIVAKIIEWGTAFLGWVATSVIPKLSSTLDSIKTSITTWITGAVTWITDQAKSLGSSIIDGIVNGINDGIDSVTSAASDMAQKALDAAMNALGIKSPSHVMAEQVGMPIPEGIAQGIEAATPQATNAMLEMAGKLADLVAQGVGAFGALRGYSGVGWQSIAAFAFDLMTMIQNFQNVVAAFDTKAIETASKFAESVGKIVAIVGTGVDGFTKLRDFQAVGWRPIAAFAASLMTMIQNFQNVVRAFDATAIESAGKFAESVGKVIAIIGAGVDAFAKLATFTQLPRGVAQAFSISILWVVKRIAEVAGWIGVNATAAAAVFAEGAGKVIAIIGAGVDGFTKLATFTGVSQGAINLFGQAILLTVARIGLISQQFTVEGVAAAAAFAEGAGKVVSIVGAGVDGFIKLATFQGVSEAAVNLFGQALRLTVARIALISQQFTVEGTAAAALFAEGAGKIVSIVGSGVDAFTKLAAFAGVPGPALQLFAAAVIALIATVARLAVVVSADALAQAVRFANGMNLVITTITGALNALSKLGADAAGVPAFLQTFTAAVVRIANDFSSQVVPPAMTIGRNIAIGIANGILSGAGAIQNAIFAAVNAALAAARAALGIASPSQVFKDQIGLQMSAGMAQGVLGGMGGVQAAVGQVSRGAITSGPGASTTNNNQRSISIAPGAIVIQGAGQNADAIGDAVVRRLELAIGGRLA